MLDLHFLFFMLIFICFTDIHKIIARKNSIFAEQNYKKLQLLQRAKKLMKRQVLLVGLSTRTRKMSTSNNFTLFLLSLVIFSHFFLSLKGRKMKTEMLHFISKKYMQTLTTMIKRRQKFYEDKKISLRLT